MKNELRKLYKDIRKNIIINPTAYATQLKQLIPQKQMVSIYYPLKNELNILLIMEQFQENLFALPILQGQNEPLLFHTYIQGKTQLHFNKYAYEPIIQENELVIPKYCIVPLLCFDPITKHRIGYGGGYYDTTIKYYRMNNYDTIFIGLGHEFLKCNNLPNDSYDQQLDVIITESKIYD